MVSTLACSVRKIAHVAAAGDDDCVACCYCCCCCCYCSGVIANHSAIVPTLQIEKWHLRMPSENVALRKMRMTFSSAFVFVFADAVCHPWIMLGWCAERHVLVSLTFWFDLRLQQMEVGDADADDACYCYSHRHPPHDHDTIWMHMGCRCRCRCPGYEPPSAWTTTTTTTTCY